MKIKKEIFICVDFDGTCVEHKFPLVGKTLPMCIEKLREFVAKDYKIILYTMRDKETLNDAILWFSNNNIPLYGINDNPSQHKWTTSPKVFADVYIDDMAYGVPLVYPKNSRPYVDWSKINL